MGFISDETIAAVSGTDYYYTYSDYLTMNAVRPRRAGPCPCDIKHEGHKVFIKKLKSAYDKAKIVWVVKPDLFHVKFVDMKEVNSLFSKDVRVYDNINDARKKGEDIANRITKLLNSKARIRQMEIEELIKVKSFLPNVRFGEQTVEERIETLKKNYINYLDDIKRLTIRVPKKLMCLLCGDMINPELFILERHFPKEYKKWKKNLGFNVTLP